MIKCVCYDGGIMNLSGWEHPIIINIVGMEIPSLVPLLFNNKTVAHVQVYKTKEGTLEFGWPENIENTNLAIPIEAMSFQIGVDVDKREFSSKDFINVNEKTFNTEDGIDVMQKSRLREISIKINVDATFQDNVNHPAHYTSHPSGIECIEIAKHYDFCIGNAIKYLWRSGLKHEEGMDDKAKQVEDLKKAIWYINQKIEMLEAK